MCISRVRVARNFQYHLKSVSLAEEQSSKYPGVDLQSKDLGQFPIQSAQILTACGLDNA